MPDQNDLSSQSPQSLVDAALGTQTEVKQPEVSAPVVEPVVTPLSPPPLAPLVAPVAPVSPMPSVAMGDDTPLAFATMPVSTTTTTTTSSTQPSDAFIPPVPGPGSAPLTAPSPAPLKKKGGMGKILGVFLGLLMLGGAAFGGYSYYVNNFGEEAKIAVVVSKLDQKSCSGCSADKDGGWLVWRNGECKVSGTCNSTKNDSQNSDNPNPSAPPAVATTKEECEKKVAGANGTLVQTGFWCGKTPDGTCGGFCNTTTATSCDKLLQEKCGYTQTYGASCSTTQDSKYFFKCDCGSNGGIKFFDRQGLCTHPTGDTGPNAVTDNGLCAVKASCDNNVGGTQYNCTNDGCTALGASCYIKKYTCKEVVVGYSCTPNTPGFISQSATIQAGTNVKFDSKCGTVEQIDVSCGGTNPYATSRTKINPPCTTPSKPPVTPPPSAPPSIPPVVPTMACTGLTSSPALTQTGPAIGAKLTFTCAGVVTPATAGTLSFKFRYSINSAASKALTNKTPTTAELTIASCGSYLVECQACATLKGVLTCDPKWIGATQ